MKRCWILHSWGKWNAYQVNKYYVPSGGTFADKMPFVETRQKRICDRCGFVQDKRVRGMIWS